MRRLVKAISLQESDLTPAQCRMARAALELGVRDLAEAAKVSTNTITRLERGEPLKERTVEAIQRALEAAGVEFTNDGQPGVRMRADAHQEAAQMPPEPHAAALRKAQAAIDEALASSPAPAEEKARRKRQLTRMATTLREPGGDSTAAAVRRRPAKGESKKQP